MGLPDAIPGYSNNLILGAILPLLQNAVEASPKTDEILLSYESEPKESRIIFDNHFIEPVVTEALYERGKTTKAGHDGLGVPSVNDLLSYIAGASLTYEIDNEILRVIVMLPTQSL